MQVSIIKQHVTWRRGGGGRDFFHLLPQCCLLPNVIKNEKLKSQKTEKLIDITHVLDNVLK